MDDEIHREPWLSYLKLLEYKKSALAMSESDALWWLLRKAETEHLLYFKDDFAKTVQQAQSKVTEQTPEEIASKLNVFSGMLATINGDYAISINFFNKALSQAKSAGLNIIYIMGKQELAYSRSLTESYDTSLIELQGAYVEAFATILYIWFKTKDKNFENFKKKFEIQLQYSLIIIAKLLALQGLTFSDISIFNSKPFKVKSNVFQYYFNKVQFMRYTLVLEIYKTLFLYRVYFIFILKLNMLEQAVF